jgi:hypothetical protein
MTMPTIEPSPELNDLINRAHRAGVDLSQYDARSEKDLYRLRADIVQAEMDNAQRREASAKPLDPTDHYVWGSAPDGLAEAFEAAFAALSPYMDVKRMVLSVEGGQDQVVQSALICNRTNPKYLRRMLLRHTDALEGFPTSSVPVSVGEFEEQPPQGRGPNGFAPEDDEELEVLPAPRSED